MKREKQLKLPLLERGVVHNTGKGLRERQLKLPSILPRSREPGETTIKLIGLIDKGQVCTQRIAAEKLGVTYQRVQQIMTENGLKFRNPRQQPNTPLEWPCPRCGGIVKTTTVLVKKWRRGPFCKKCAGSAPLPTSPVLQCAVEVCIREARTHGFCGAHYERKRRGQRMDTSIAEYSHRNLGCRVNDCKDEHYAKKFCRRHHARSLSLQRRYPDLDPLTIMNEDLAGSSRLRSSS